MERLQDWRDLQRLVNRVPRHFAKFSTNLFVGQQKIDSWAAAGVLRVLATQQVVVLLRTDQDFQHIYHIAEDLSALTGALAVLPRGTYTADIIGRENSLDPVCDAYRNAGFDQHAFLRRMSRAGVNVMGEIIEGVIAATPEDADDIAFFLGGLLDRFTEQIPDLDELRLAASEGRLLVQRRGSIVAGMLMYDLNGQTAHLRFWHVAPDARGTGVGRGLMTMFLSRCVHVKRIVLWVIGDNHRSIAIYRHYGFDTDGLLDRVMISDKETQ